MLSPFDTSIQCEEFFAGYEDWSDELQAEFEAANEEAQTVETPTGSMMIPRECLCCNSSKCKNAYREGGFDL
jgi:hypothetical protein